MRIGLISDIHGNFTALEAVLANMNQRPVDLLVCLGDIATIGPQPRQVLDTLKELDCTCIMGNHDATLLDMSKMVYYQIGTKLISTIEWCAQKLDSSDLDFLRSFKVHVEIPLDNDLGLLCYHGSPQSSTDQVLVTTTVKELAAQFSGHHNRLLAGGHTHIQMMRQHKSSLIINPGSVGSPFKTAYEAGVPPVLLPWAEYGIIEYKDGVISVDLRRVPFDMDVFIKAIKESGMPNSGERVETYNRSKKEHYSL
ncbi:MAG: metallophosphatase family protein [Anaerolineales bacterium]|nr:metallophosphatase family protein [Anaerolineales bacterium]